MNDTKKTDCTIQAEADRKGEYFFGSKTPTLNIPSFAGLAELAAIMGNKTTATTEQNDFFAVETINQESDFDEDGFVFLVIATTQEGNEVLLTQHVSATVPKYFLDTSLQSNGYVGYNILGRKQESICKLLQGAGFPTVEKRSLAELSADGFALNEDNGCG